MPKSKNSSISSKNTSYFLPLSILAVVLFLTGSIFQYFSTGSGFLTLFIMPSKSDINLVSTQTFVPNPVSFSPIKKWTNSFDLNHGWTVAKYVRTVGDVNADGKADLVGFGQDGVYVSLSNGTGFEPIKKWTVDFSNTQYSTQWSGQPNTVPQYWTNDKTTRLVGDFNGDKAADLIGYSADGVYVAYSNGTSFSPKIKWSLAYYLNNSADYDATKFVRTIGDVTGDGRTDLVGFGQDGVYGVPSSPVAPTIISMWIPQSFDLNHGWTTQDYVRTTGDVSGDGKADFIGFGIDGVYVSRSLYGENSVPNSPLMSPISKLLSGFDRAHGWTVSEFVRTVDDVNGDKYADLVGFGLDGVYISLSTGTGFTPPAKLLSAFDKAHSWTVKDFVRTTGDVNGDGKADLVGFGLDGVYVSLAN